jgi:hypothetical protein
MKGYMAVLAVVLILAVALIAGATGFTIGKTQARRAIFREACERGPMMLPGGDMMPDMRKAERFHRFRDFAKNRPEDMKEMMAERKDQIRERLTDLKKRDPDKFREVMQRMDMLEDNISSLRRELEAEPVK